MMRVSEIFRRGFNRPRYVINLGRGEVVRTKSGKMKCFDSQTEAENFMRRLQD